MTFDPAKPFNDLPLLPPRGDIETKPVLKKAISAGRALAELKGIGEILPNQAGIRRTPGTAISNMTTGEVIYTPPEGESVIRDKLKNLEETAVFTRERIQAIRELMNKTMERARKDLPSRAYSKELIELLFHQPYTKGQFLVDAGVAKRQTAAEYLKELEKIGVLKARTIGRETLYLNTRLFDLLSK